jgi:hypothetical protein
VAILPNNHPEIGFYPVYVWQESEICINDPVTALPFSFLNEPEIRQHLAQIYQNICLQSNRSIPEAIESLVNTYQARKSVAIFSKQSADFYAELDIAHNIAIADRATYCENLIYFRALAQASIAMLQEENLLLTTQVQATQDIAAQALDTANQALELSIKHETKVLMLALKLITQTEQLEEKNQQLIRANSHAESERKYAEVAEGLYAHETARANAAESRILDLEGEIARLNAQSFATSTPATQRPAQIVPYSPVASEQRTPLEHLLNNAIRTTANSSSSNASAGVLNAYAGGNNYLPSQGKAKTPSPESLSTSSAATVLDATAPNPTSSIWATLQQATLFRLDA